MIDAKDIVHESRPPMTEILSEYSSEDEPIISEILETPEEYQDELEFKNAREFQLNKHGSTNHEAQLQANREWRAYERKLETKRLKAEAAECLSQPLPPMVDLPNQP